MGFSTIPGGCFTGFSGSHLPSIKKPGVFPPPNRYTHGRFSASQHWHHGWRHWNPWQAGHAHPPRFEIAGCFPTTGDFPPKWMVKIRESPIRIDDLGGKPPIFGNIQLVIVIMEYNDSRERNLEFFLAGFEAAKRNIFQWITLKRRPVMAFRKNSSKFSACLKQQQTTEKGTRKSTAKKQHKVKIWFSSQIASGVNPLKPLTLKNDMGWLFNK